MKFAKKKTESNAEVESVEPVKPKKVRAEKAQRPKKPSSGKTSGTSARGKRFVFIIGDEGTILVFIQGSKVVRRLFAPTPQPAHTEVMLEIIRANPTVPIYVLVDVLDQQYVPQTFPPVSAMSVGGLVKRRLARDFQPDDLTNSLSLGRDKTGRKEWRYLLISLAKTPLISDWADLIINLPNELKGIYLSPIESIVYLDMLSKKVSAGTSPWQMLISHNKVSGFRQVVVNEGKLVFTRVSQAIDDAIPAVIAGNIEQEIINTLEYLKRLEFKDEGLLEVYVIVSQDVAESLDLKRFAFAQSHVLTPLAVAEALSLEQAALSADRFGDVVMAAAFGISKKRMLRFATPYLDRLAQLYKAKMALKVAAIAIAALLVVMSLMSVVTIVGDYNAISESEESDKKIAPDLQNVRKQITNLNVDVAYQSAVISTWDAYLKGTPKPEDALQLIVGINSPQSRINNVHWMYVDPAAKKDPGSAVTGPVELSFEVDLKNAGSTADQLTKYADDMLAQLKEKMPDYEIKADPYVWLGDKSNQQTLDLNDTAVDPAKKTMRIVISGPKKAKAA